jgi:hypothetical protein
MNRAAAQHGPAATTGSSACARRASSVHRPDGGAAARGPELGRALSVPPGEDAVVLGARGASVLSLFQLQGGRRSLQFRGGDRAHRIPGGGRAALAPRRHSRARAARRRGARHAHARSGSARGGSRRVRAVAVGSGCGCGRAQLSRGPRAHARNATWLPVRVRPSGMGEPDRAPAREDRRRHADRSGPRGAPRGSQCRRPLRPLPQPADGAAGRAGRRGGGIRCRALAPGHAEVSEFPETAVYHRGSFLFGFDAARRAGGTGRRDDRGGGVTSTRSRCTRREARAHRGDVRHCAHERSGAHARSASSRAWR